MIQMRNVSRRYLVVSRGADTDSLGHRTQRTIVAICPFCQGKVKIFVWALHGNGKLCPCGAKFDSGTASKVIELEGPECTESERIELIGGQLGSGREPTGG
jgi:hypothetical protein